MNAETFFEHFETFTESLNGVAKLRELILQLAVQGKLVSQDVNDEPALVILERASKASSKLQDGTKPKGKQTAAKMGLPKHLPECPNGWEWSMLGELGVVSPRNDLLDDIDVSFLPMASISTKYNGPLQPEVRKWRDVKQGFTHLADGDIAMAKITPCFQNGKTTVMNKLTNGHGAGTTELYVLRPYPNCLIPEYAVIFLRSPLFVAEGVETMSGTAGQQRVRKEHFAESPFPLPPLAEQRRIVEKVDQLLGLCDELAARQAAKREVRSALVGATLDRVVSVRTASDFPAQVKRLHNNFDRLFDTPTTIPQLRQAILQLAVQGQLVPQDPNDEPAGILLERISLQKFTALRRKKVTDIDSLPEIPSNPPFAGPESWVWATLDDVHITAHTGIDRGKSQQSPTMRYAYLKMNNITADGKCDTREVTRIDATDEEVAKNKLRVGDFLFNTRNSAELVGKTCVFTSSTDDTFLFNNNILRVHFGEGVNSHFANLWFCSPPGQELLNERKSSTTNVAAIYQGKLLTMPFPVPPLSEQKRIVSRVSELLSLCDDLEAQLTQAEFASTQLLSAAVHQILEGKS